MYLIKDILVEPSRISSHDKPRFFITTLERLIEFTTRIWLVFSSWIYKTSYYILITSYYINYIYY